MKLTNDNIDRLLQCVAEMYDGDEANGGLNTGEHEQLRARLSDQLLSEATRKLTWIEDRMESPPGPDTLRHVVECSKEALDFIAQAREIRGVKR